MTSLSHLIAAVAAGKRKEVRVVTQELLEQGMPPMDVVEKALTPGMGIVGEKFKNNEIFVSEMLVAARAIKEAMLLLEPLLAKAGIRPKHTVIIGSVHGDLHDIGKNLVAIMLKGANLGVIDLGINVSPQRFAQAAIEHKASIVALSALLTTTMPAMRTTVEVLRKSPAKRVKVMIGGAPTSNEFAEKIGADGYSADAVGAVDLALHLIGESRQSAAHFN